MFGLINPGRQDRVYRRAYARCCQHQRRRYGAPSLAFLSYESVLLYLCAVDANKVRLDELPDRLCCKLRGIKGKPSPDESEVARFSNALGLLLASIKLNDDLRDGPSLLARLAHWLLQGRFREAFAYFSRLDPSFANQVNGFVAAHVALEQPGRSVPLEDYVEPTAQAFGYVFSLMGRLPGMEDLTSVLAAVGRHVGTAIIAYDCAVDWHKDQRRGQFNPLPDDVESVRAALTLARRELLQAATVWRERLGAGSHVGRVLEQVARRLPGACDQPNCRRFHRDIEARLRRWGVRRERQGVQLNEGFDVVVGLCTFTAMMIGGLACCFGSKSSATEKIKAADVPPAQDETRTQPDPNLEAARVAATNTQVAPAPAAKKGDCDVMCCDCPCDAGCDSCDGCDGCGNVGEACNGCDCGGCDISC